MQYTDQDVINGKPRYFDIEQYIDTIEQLLSADEVLLAKHMIDNPPGYYREFPSERLNLLKLEVERLIPTHDYYVKRENEHKHIAEAYECSLQGIKSLSEMIDIPFCQPRGSMVIDLVKFFNEKNHIPLITELGPAQYWLPLGLIAKGLKFKYRPLTLNLPALETYKEDLEDVLLTDGENHNGPHIFVCFEVIEHVINLDEIKEVFKSINSPDVVMISTPRNTFWGGKQTKDMWRDNALEHVRTFTPHELARIGIEIWPEFNFEIVASLSMVLVGRNMMTWEKYSI